MQNRNLIFMPIIGLDKKKRTESSHYLSVDLGIESDQVKTILEKVDLFITHIDYRSERRHDEVEASYRSMVNKYGQSDWQVMRDLFKAMKIIHVNHHYSTADNVREPFCKAYSIENGFYRHLLPRPKEGLLPMLRDKRRKAKARPHTLNINHAVNAAYAIYKATYRSDKPAALSKLVSDMRRLETFIQRQYYKKSDRINAKGFSYAAGQVYTPLNNLPSYMRKLIRYKRKPTAQIDIQASMPTILYALISDESEKAAWSGLVERDVYSILPDVARPLVKDAFVRWLGGRSLNTFDGRNNYGAEESLRGTMQALDGEIKQLIPKAYATLSEDRSEGALSDQLQTLQAAVINQVSSMKDSAKPIHDCVICSVDDLDDLKDKFSTDFTQIIGIHPVLTIE